MDKIACNIIYVDSRARRDHVVHSQDVVDGNINGDLPDAVPQSLKESIEVLRDAFGDVHVCATSTSCLSALSDLYHSNTLDHTPTIILIDIPFDDRLPERNPRSRSPSPHSRGPREKEEPEAQISDVELYGLRLLQRIVAEADMHKLMKLVVPIPVISHTLHGIDGSPEEGAVGGTLIPTASSNGRSSHPELVQTCLEYGAVDVLTSPLQLKHMECLEVHAFVAHQAAAKERQALMQVRKNRKRSWVGVETGGKPFAYLREAMVSGLMRGICRLDDDDEVDGNSLGTFRISVSTERQASIAEAVGNWHFCAHDFSDDELVVAASIMFNHALSMPELEQWRIPPDQLTQFVIACRAAYNNFVPYHNFRHVVDVLQATFSFLIHTSTLAPYAYSDKTEQSTRSPMEALLMPFEALTLLITAIGHDVGHPGVNNGFLVTLNAPLAQLYNDRSVLESFHCAAFSQILRRHWPSAFEDRKMRNLMISSILATDMGLHFDYMKKLADLKEKLHANNSTEGWNGRMTEEQKALACALLIKCADISNVARRHDTALQWMDILADEFTRQRSMEKELEIPTSLMAPPLKERASQFRSQLNFMNMFAVPLFQGVADVLPSLKYCVIALGVNSDLFHSKVTDAQVKTSSPGAISTEGQSEARSQESSTLLPLRISQAGAQKKHQILSGKLGDAIGKPASSPELRSGFRGLNGATTDFEAGAQFNGGDPFNSVDERRCHTAKQRCSETTDGSSCPPGTADCASSATTGKMPLSPSTRGTSMVSQDSLDRPSSSSIPTINAPDSAKSMTEPKLGVQPVFEVESASSLRASEDKSEKSLKKRPSRFRMNAFPFFRKHKSSPGSAAEAP